MSPFSLVTFLCDWLSITPSDLSLFFFGLLCLYFLSYFHSWLTKRRLLQRAISLKSLQREENISLLHQHPLYYNWKNYHEKSKRCTAGEIVKMVQKGEMKAVELLIGFYARAVEANQTCNFISEHMFKFALERANEIDAMTKEKKKTMPLCGLPMSLKDQFFVKGYDTTHGLAHMAGKPEPEHGGFVNLLLEAGAVPFIKTNVPQTLLSFECVNPVFGRTKNPVNQNYTSGGSSGGEGVALACSASPLGVGSDIGGSGRIPAHFCGVMGFKPTSRRLLKSGVRPAKGQDHIKGSLGPLGCCVDDIALLMRVWLSPKTQLQDSCLVYKPFDESQFRATNKLKIGYYCDDGFLTASPACSRAVLLAVDALKVAGHEVVLFKPPHVSELIGLFYGIMSADGAESRIRQLELEVWEPMVTQVVRSVLMPSFIRKLLHMFFQFRNDSNICSILQYAGKKSVYEYHLLGARMLELKQAFFDAWIAQGFDAIVAPGHVLPAIPHEGFGKISYTVAPTALYNCLDFPAGQVPITTVHPTDTYVNASTGFLENIVRKYYNPVEMSGLPVGVQIVTLPFEEEKALRIMKVVADLIPFNVSEHISI